MAYSERQNKDTMKYKSKAIKRIPFEVQKTFFEEVLKPAAVEAGEPMNTYIKKAIDARLAAEGKEKKIKKIF